MPSGTGLPDAYRVAAKVTLVGEKSLARPEARAGRMVQGEQRASVHRPRVTGLEMTALPSNRLFDTDAQVRPRGKPRFYSLCAGQLRRYPSKVALEEPQRSFQYPGRLR